MHIKWGVIGAALLIAACLLSSAARADSLVTNGDFGTGDLTGWSTFTTSNGTNGSGLPDVVLFNTTGAGATDSAHFNVGEVTFDGTQQGGGISQTITVTSTGLYTFGASIASQDDASGQINTAAGLFSILIDGTTEASTDLGPFSTAYQVLQGTVGGTVDLTPGTYTFSVEITRPYLAGGTITPDEYVTDIFVTTPEPGSFVMLGLGLAGLLLASRTGFRGRRRFVTLADPPSRAL